jgi:integrase/recombinase XerC
MQVTAFPQQPARIRLEDAIVEWEMYLTTMGRRPQGRERYAYHVRAFAAWLPVTMLDDVQSQHIRRYREHLGAQGLKPGTINLALSAINSLCVWAIEAEYLERNPAVNIRRPKIHLPPPTPLTDTELAALFVAVDRVGREPWQSDYGEHRRIWQRNRRAIYLALYAGLRLGECIALRWRDVDMTRRTIQIVNGKGGKHRNVPIHDALYHELQECGQRPPDEAVVSKADGTALSIKSASHIFDRWLAARGVAIHAHQLRHTFATALMNNGVSLREIQVMMGHESIETTMRYLEVSSRHLQQHIAALRYDVE